MKHSKEAIKGLKKFVNEETVEKRSKKKRSADLPTTIRVGKLKTQNKLVTPEKQLQIAMRKLGRNGK